MNRLRSEIRLAEETYKDLLESFFNSLYPGDKLISHGLDHHRRVWGYAKELLRRMDAGVFIVDRTFIQKLIIACYLHDAGMAIDSGERHGRHSREICLSFLKENDMNESRYSDLLSAIENHDDKEYADPGNKDLLLTILSAADDLDAFGEEGIARYTEIYRERGIKDCDIGNAVRENAAKRFANFERIFGSHPDLIEKHKKRYLLLDFHFKKSKHGVARS